MYSEQYMTGKLSMQAIMQILGANKVCCVAFERMDISTATIIAKLQSDLMELHHQAIHSTDQTYDWTLGILIKLAQVPQEDGGLGQEDWPLGQRLSNQDIMIVPMWHVIDKAMWPSHVAEDSLEHASGYNSGPVQVQRCMGGHHVQW